MKKHPSSGSASFSINIKKVSRSTISPRPARKSGSFPLLYIIYIFNGNNDAMTQSPVCRSSKRVIIRVIINLARKRRALRLLACVYNDAPSFLMTRLCVRPPFCTDFTFPITSFKFPRPLHEMPQMPPYRICSAR